MSTLGQHDDRRSGPSTAGDPPTLPDELAGEVANTESHGSERDGWAEVVPLRRHDQVRRGVPDRSVGLRDLIGEVLRDERHRQERTLADVAEAAAVSLPYLSEVERGRKDVSSELLGAMHEALGLDLADVLERAARRLEVRAQSGHGFRMLAA